MVPRHDASLRRPEVGRRAPSFKRLKGDRELRRCFKEGPARTAVVGGAGHCTLSPVPGETGAQRQPRPQDRQKGTISVDGGPTKNW